MAALGTPRFATLRGFNLIYSAYSDNIVLSKFSDNRLSTWWKCELVLSFQGEVAIVERVSIKN
jgi:hypothetical protein